jgi:hypothetical protein
MLHRLKSPQTFFTTASIAPAAAMSYADPYLGDRQQPYANNYNFGIEHTRTPPEFRLRLLRRMQYAGGGQCMPNYNTAFSGPVRINGKWEERATAALSPNYINISAFSNPTAYTFGNLARTAAYGLCGQVNFDLDMSLKRTIPIHEAINFLVDISAYSVTNSMIFGAPPVSTGTPSTFGKLTSQANNSRDIQLAFRLNF